MATEIERKFLVANDSWRAAVVGQARLVQGYLVAEPRLTVRVRIGFGSGADTDAGVGAGAETEAGSGTAGGAGAPAQAWLTIKGASRGIARAEFEYRIPLADAEAMLATLTDGAAIDKTRYQVRHGAALWELDVFAGANAGLVVAELELAAIDQPFDRPPWLGAEVSGDPRYYNAALLRRPFSTW